jgi:hypothetical protein
MATDPTFGPAFDERQDGRRIRTQLEQIRDHMLGRREWASLHEIALATGYPEASVSAQLRHLRKPKFGGFDVRRRRRTWGKGTNEYRVLEPFSLAVEDAD